MMTKNAYAFVVIEESVMVFKHAKDKGLIPIFESFVPLKEGFLKNFKERCNLEFLENLDLLFLYDKPSAHEIFFLVQGAEKFHLGQEACGSFSRGFRGV
ncbi:hypothetical protein HpBT206_02250 [Helicobacter pylori]